MPVTPSSVTSSTTTGWSLPVVTRKMLTVSTFILRRSREGRGHYSWPHGGAVPAGDRSCGRRSAFHDRRRGGSGTGRRSAHHRRLAAPRGAAALRIRPWLSRRLLSHGGVPGLLGAAGRRAARARLLDAGRA